MSLLRTFLVSAFSCVSLFVVACASKSSGATSSDKICTAGAYVYCRCANREEGTKLCQDDGKGFDKCEPCETATNPEDPNVDNPYVPAPDDGGALAKCGDKIVQIGEECDDGNTDSIDGCDLNCVLSGTDVLSSRSCPGMPIHVFSGPVQYTTTTVGSPNTASIATSCPSSEGNNPTSGAAASDRIFAVTAHKTGTMTVSTADTNFDNWIYVVANGCTAGAQTTYLACSNKVAGTGSETVSFPVEQGKTYSVIVDGVLTAQGAFRIKLQIQ